MVVALVGLVAATAGCSNKVVALAAAPHDTTTTAASTGPTTTVTQLPCLSCLASGALDANNPSQTQIDHSPINALRIREVQAITTKLTALNQVSTQLNTVTHLSAAALATERAEISGAVQGLTSLKLTISAEQNVALMRQEASHLVDFTTVGTVIVPKVILIVAADGIRRATDILFQQAPGLQTKIDDAANRGKPVADPQNSLNDLKAQAGQAASQADGLLASVPSLTSAQLAEITADQSVLASAKTQLSAAQADVGKIDSALAAVAG